MRSFNVPRPIRSSAQPCNRRTCSSVRHVKGWILKALILIVQITIRELSLLSATRIIQLYTALKYVLYYFNKPKLLQCSISTICNPSTALRWCMFKHSAKYGDCVAFLNRFQSDSNNNTPYSVNCYNSVNLAPFPFALVYYSIFW